MVFSLKILISRLKHPKNKIVIGEPTTVTLEFKFPANQLIDSVEFQLASSRDTLGNNWELWGKSILEKNTKDIITEIGVSAGLGFRFKKLGNQIDFNYYYGLRDYKMLKKIEYFQQFQLSTSLADLWFVKRRQK